MAPEWPFVQLGVWLSSCTAPNLALAMQTQKQQPDPVVVIGAGPAGLTAGYELVTRGVPVVILEKDSDVGGLARTVEYKGFRFDIGGHRFFTKVAAVAKLWNEMLGREFLRRSRLSRIYYEGRFFDYPLKPMNALSNLGTWTSFCVLLSFDDRVSVGRIQNYKNWSRDMVPDQRYACLGLGYFCFAGSRYAQPSGRLTGQTQPAVPRLL